MSPWCCIILVPANKGGPYKSWCPFSGKTLPREFWKISVQGLDTQSFHFCLFYQTSLLKLPVHSVFFTLPFCPGCDIIGFLLSLDLFLSFGMKVCESWKTCTLFLPFALLLHLVGLWLANKNTTLADKAPPCKTNCAQLCNVASNSVQPFNMCKVQMALQPVRQIFSQPCF